MPDDHVVPSYRPSQITRNERKNDIIYKRVKKIAARAGVEAHPHAIRAAFAVYFLEAHKGSIRSLQELLGHESIDTTRHYTRALNRRQLTSEVVDMDWGVLSETGHNEVFVHPGEGATSPVSERTSKGALSEGVVEDAQGREPAASLLSHGTPSLSALSEGVSSGESGHAVSLGGSTRSLSALSAEQAEVLSNTPESCSALSALTPGVFEAVAQSDRAESDGRAKPCAQEPRASGVSTIMAHDMEPESLSDQFPCGIEEAHTGFEPVLRRQVSVRLGLAGTGHHLRHGTI
jgi:hypothetical protein